MLLNQSLYMTRKALLLLRSLSLSFYGNGQVLSGRFLWILHVSCPTFAKNETHIQLIIYREYKRLTFRGLCTSWRGLWVRMPIGISPNPLLRKWHPRREGALRFSNHDPAGFNTSQSIVSSTKPWTDAAPLPSPALRKPSKV